MSKSCGAQECAGGGGDLACEHPPPPRPRDHGPRGPALGLPGLRPHHSSQGPAEGRGCAAAGARAGGPGRRGRAPAAQPPARQPRLRPAGPRHRGCQHRAGAKQESAHRGGELGVFKCINRCEYVFFLDRDRISF